MAASGRRLWSPAKGKGAAPHRPTLTSSLVAALLAVGVVMGFVVLRTGSSTPSGERSTTTTTGPSIRVPSAVVPTPVIPRTTAPQVAPSTAAPATPATPATPASCTAQDLRVTTDASAGTGGSVALVTRLQVLRTCVFDPAPVPPFACPDSIVVDTAGGSQAWPDANGEQCHGLSAGTLPAGTIDTLNSVWPNPPAGSYRAVGIWGWSAGSGDAPQQVTATTSFSVS